MPKSGQGNGPRTIGQTVDNLIGKRLTWDHLTGKNDVYADVDLLNNGGPETSNPRPSQHKPAPIASRVGP